MTDFMGFVKCMLSRSSGVVERHQSDFVPNELSRPAICVDGQGAGVPFRWINDPLTRETPFAQTLHSPLHRQLCTPPDYPYVSRGEGGYPIGSLFPLFFAVTGYPLG